MTPVNAHSKRRPLIEEGKSVDKCDCGPDHPAHADQKRQQRPNAPWAGQGVADGEGGGPLRAGPVPQHADVEDRFPSRAWP